MKRRATAAERFIQRELDAWRWVVKKAQGRMDWYGRKKDRPRTKAECDAWCRAYDNRMAAQREVQFLERLLKKARRSRV